MSFSKHLVPFVRGGAPEKAECRMKEGKEREEKGEGREGEEPFSLPHPPLGCAGCSFFAPKEYLSIDIFFHLQIISLII